MDEAAAGDDEAAEHDGDSACWLHFVCDECGAVVTPADGHRPACSASATCPCRIPKAAEPSGRGGEP